MPNNNNRCMQNWRKEKGERKVVYCDCRRALCIGKNWNYFALVRIGTHYLSISENSMELVFVSVLTLVMSSSFPFFDGY